MDTGAGAGVVGEVRALATDFHGSARIENEREGDRIGFAIRRADAAEEFNIAHIAPDRPRSTSNPWKSVLIRG